MIGIVAALAAGGVIGFMPRDSQVSEPRPGPSKPDPGGIKYDKPDKPAKLVKVPTEEERAAFLHNMLVDINTSPASLIERISGVGPGMAKKLVKYRDKNGPFKSFYDLDAVPGVGPTALKSLRAGIRPLEGGDLRATPSGPIDLNTATLEDLETINGISSKKAGDIINYRKENNGFGSVDELINVSGIGPKTLENLRPFLKASTLSKQAQILKDRAPAPKKKKSSSSSKKRKAKSSGKKININTASAKEIAAGLNGVGPKTAERIVAYRKENGKFSSVDSLTDVKGIGPKTLSKFSSQATVN